MYSGVEKYSYKPLGFAGKLYGAFFFLAGWFFIYLFIQQVAHRNANLGGTPGSLLEYLNFFLCSYRLCEGGDGAFSLVLWVGFALAALGITFIGVLLFFGEREVTLEATTIVVRDIKGLWTRRYMDGNIRYIVVQPQMLFAVFGGSGMPVRTSVVGKQYGVVLRPRNKRRSITLCASRDQAVARKTVALLLQRYTTQPEFTEVYLDTLASTQTLAPQAKELFVALCALWEETYSHLHVVAQHSYTDSEEAFPLSGNISVDLDQCADALGWSKATLEIQLQALDRAGLARRASVL